MTKKQKLNKIFQDFLHTDSLTLYEALDKAYTYGGLEITAKYQIDIDNQIDKVNNVLDTLKEIKNGK